MIKRDYCSACKTGVACFLIKDGRICLLCFDRTKRDTELSIDELHQIDIKQVKIALGLK